MHKVYCYMCEGSKITDMSLTSRDAVECLLLQGVIGELHGLEVAEDEDGRRHQAHGLLPAAPWQLKPVAVVLNGVDQDWTQHVTCSIKRSQQ